jgi:Fic family protein
MDIWDEIEAEIALYHQLKLADEVNHAKYSLYSIIAHSTAIEGSTLTELDAQLMFDEGITAKGKPLVHHLMNEDLKNAYVWASLKAQEQVPISVDFIKEMNARVMKSTGGAVNMPGGTFDSAKGDFRLCGVTAGAGGASYMNFQKVPGRTAEFCNELNKRLVRKIDLRDIYRLSFDAHLNLVAIHPWLDGNGRTSRLLMNYIQFYYRVIPAKVYQEDKAEYISALQTSREQERNTPFRDFMARQLLKMLREETSKYRKSQEKDGRLMF